MSLSITLIPGALPADGTIITNALLRALAQPVVILAGSVGTAQIPDGAVTAAKLADGALSADTLGRGKMADGFLSLAKVGAGIFTADTTGRGKFVSGFVNAALLDDSTRLDGAQYAAGTTTAGVIAATLGTAPAGYVAGQTVKLLIDATNTGATDLNLNTLGAKNVFKNINQELAPGDLVAGDVATFVYDGTQFQLQRRNAPAVVGVTRNLLVKPNAGTPNTKVDLTADEISLKDANSASVIASTVTFTADITASGANGIDTGALASGTWYYLWTIYNGTTVAGLFSLSATAPTLPAGYTFKALVGVVRSDGSSHFVPFLQQDRMVWIDTTNVFTTANAGTTSYTAFTFTSVVPPIAKSALGSLGGATSSNVTMVLAGDANGLGAAYYVFSAAQSTALDGFTAVSQFDVPLATAQTLFAKMSNTGNNYQIKICGYRI